MKHLRTLIFSALLIMLIATGCSDGSKNNSKNNKLNIYTTVYPLQYFTELIGGDNVNVKSVFPAGGDAHTFEPTQKQMIEIANADLFFYIGLGLEGFATKAEQSLKNEPVSLHATGEAISHDLLSEGDDHDEHSHGNIDPHIWIDPIISIHLAEIIKEELINAKPEHEKLFNRNFEQLKNRLEQLDDKFNNVIDDASQLKLLVAHAAYGYWEKRYGIEQVSISGLSTTNEPSQQQLKNIVNTVRDNNLRYILFEQNNSPRIAKIIQTETKTESLIIHNLSVLTDEDISKKNDYFTIMEQNLGILQKALSN